MDYRGIYRLPIDSYLSIDTPAQEIADTTQDMKYYELKKYLKLAADTNPNILEVLFLSDKNKITFKNEIYDVLLEHRNLFVTKRAYYTYSGYAYAQVKRAKGLNKKVNSYSKFINEVSLKSLKNYISQTNDKNLLASYHQAIGQYLNIDVCSWLCKQLFKDITIDEGKRAALKAAYNSLMSNGLSSFLPPSPNSYVYQFDNIGQVVSYQPFRPSLIDDPSSFFKISKVSEVEHMSNMYRVYRCPGSNDSYNNGQFTCSSVTIDEELNFRGVVYYNKTNYEIDAREYSSFWEWMSNRNEARWTAQETGEMDYDSKSMMHCFRLLEDAKHIAKEGCPLVEFKDDRRDFLMNVRAGHYSYDDLMEMLNDKLEQLKGIFDKSSIRKTCDMKSVNELYKTLMRMD